MFNFFFKYGILFTESDRMTLGFASDHRGFKLKSELIKYFKENGYHVIDYGTDSEESCDYPDFAYKLGLGIVLGDVNYGIAICGSGIGINIALNKMKGVYCAKVSNKEEALHTRLDNNTNCVSFGETMNYNEAVENLIELAYGAEGAEKAKYAAMLSGKQGMSGLMAIVNASEEDFRAAIAEEMQTLGITHDEVSDLLAPPVFVNAEPVAYK